MQNFRCPPEVLIAVDRWIAAQPEPRPSRSEAIRLALKDWLTGQGLLSPVEEDAIDPSSPQPQPAEVVAKGAHARSRAGKVVDEALAHSPAPPEEKAKRKRRLTKISKGLTSK
jgi:hypothetical protein